MPKLAGYTTFAVITACAMFTPQSRRAGFVAWVSAALTAISRSSLSIFLDDPRIEAVYPSWRNS